MTFTSDNLRFSDLRGSQVNVWEPSALVRKDIDDGHSEPSESPTPATYETSVKPYEEMAVITALQCFQDGASATCGGNNGVIDVHDLSCPNMDPKELYKHKGSFTEIVLLNWVESEGILASFDNASQFRVMRLSRNKARGWSVQQHLLDGQLESKEPINQALISPDGTRLLLSTSKTDMLWSLENKKLITTNQTEYKNSWKWYTNPLEPSEVVLFYRSNLSSYSWIDLAAVSPGTVHVDFRIDKDERFDLDDVLVEGRDRLLAVKQIRDWTEARS